MTAAVVAPAAAFAVPGRALPLLRRTRPQLRCRRRGPCPWPPFSASAVERTAGAVGDDEAMSVDALHRFIDLNLGKWNGGFAVSAFLFELVVWDWMYGFALVSDLWLGGFEAI